MPSLSAINLIIVKLPFSLTVAGVVTPVVLEPALTTFITTAQGDTVNGTVYEAELHNHDYSAQYTRLEFVSTNVNTAALETAAATLMSSVAAQNPGVTVAIEVEALSGQRYS